MKFSVFTLLSVSAASVLAAPPPPSNQKVIHPNGNTAKCLSAASNSDGARVVIENCPTDNRPIPTSQLWTVSGGTFRIFGNKCLDDTNGIKTNGQKMQIWTCGNGNKNQKWIPATGQILLSGTSKCLDNTDGKTNPGNPAQIWDCTGGPNQKWSIVDARNPTGNGKTIRPGKDGQKCLTATRNSNNAAVVIERCDNRSPSQQWSATGGTLQIFGDKCLDVPNGSTTNGVKMQIYTCFNGNTNQKFTPTNSRQIQWTNKGQCLDLTDGNTNSGTPAQMWKCGNGNPNQVWNFV